jgi:Type VI secretion system/phage-baseplate injector OB domain
MTREELKSRIFIGVVEDNNDTKKLGRCKVRVLNIYDDIPVDDLPWATPWKDLNGNTFLLPEKGKIVSVVFDEGNPYKPEYIFAEHYNKNLEKKLSTLSDSDYTSMRSLMFDHKTQIYSNDSEGLMVDYMYNNINIKKDTIDINLKDNQGKLSLGDAKADQQAILGTNFMNWFDEFLDNLLGTNNGPYLGNLGAPVVANPEFIEVINKYKSLRDPKFLSQNVYIIDNHLVSTVSDNMSKRQNTPQLGDSWNTTSKNSEVGPSQDKVPDFTPQVDLNNQANIDNDPTAQSKIPTTPPAYIDNSVGPSSGLTNVFSQEMVKLAHTQLGVTEQQWTYDGKTYPAGQNSGPQVEHLYQRSTSLNGSGWSWCAAFICYLFKTVSSQGVQHSFKLPNTASAYDFRNWARNNASFVDVFEAPFSSILPGDIIIFNFSHIGISVGSLKGDRVDTIEGNTTGQPAKPSQERDGGGVYKKSRKTSIIKTVIRLKYNPNQVKPVNK